LPQNILKFKPLTLNENEKAYWLYQQAFMVSL